MNEASAIVAAAFTNFSTRFSVVISLESCDVSRESVRLLTTAAQESADLYGLKRSLVPGAAPEAPKLARLDAVQENLLLEEESREARSGSARRHFVLGSIRLH